MKVKKFLVKVGMVLLLVVTIGGVIISIKEKKESENAIHIVQNGVSKINEERMAEAKRRAEGSPSWGWSWQAYFSPQLIPDYSKEFETVNDLENILSKFIDVRMLLIYNRRHLQKSR